MSLLLRDQFLVDWENAEKRWRNASEEEKEEHYRQTHELWRNRPVAEWDFCRLKTELEEGRELTPEMGMRCFELLVAETHENARMKNVLDRIEDIARCGEYSEDYDVV